MKNGKTLFLGMAMCFCAVSSVTASSVIASDSYNHRHNLYDDSMTREPSADENLDLIIIRHKDGNIIEVRIVRSYADLEHELSKSAPGEEIMIVTEDNDEEIVENNTH